MICESGKIVFGFYIILFLKVYKSSFRGLNIIEKQILIFFVPLLSGYVIRVRIFMRSFFLLKVYLMD